MNDIDKTIEVNKRQKEFYNSNEKSKKNFVSRIWSTIRNGVLNDFRQEFEIKNRVYDLHKEWLGDLSDKKILDLGCLRGNALSIYMAKNAKEYVGIDLSDNAINYLSEKLKKENCNNAKAIAIDFLSPNFKEANFDIIYAYGVLHHFEDFNVLISRLKEKLNSNGKIISYDPLSTSLPIRIFRSLYRPFQSDKDWEWPFEKKTIRNIESNFKILEHKGILGRSKYGLGLKILPLPKSYKKRKIKRLIEKDWNSESIKQIYSCMQVTFLLQKKT